MAAERIWTAALVVIGDEILSGRTQDKNVAQIAAWLNVQGIRLAEVRVVPDNMDIIAEAVLERYYATRGGITAARARMARVPAGASLIVNKVSGAPGIRWGNIFIMAGVPHITAGMLDALTGTLEGGRPVVSKSVGGWVPESEVADLLRATEKAHEGVAIGSYPFFREGRVGANFVVRSPDEALVDACVGDLSAKLEAAGHPVVAGGI